MDCPSTSLQANSPELFDNAGDADGGNEISQQLVSFSDVEAGLLSFGMHFNEKLVV